MVKVCIKCKVEKPLTEFYKTNDNKSGFRNDCKDCFKQYYQANKEHINERNRKWYQDNKEHYNEYRKERKKTDALFKMKGNLRTRTSLVFRNKGYSKNTKTQEILGVDWEVTKQHIERQFKKGMSWDNY